jgi:hypothetical protein
MKTLKVLLFVVFPVLVHSQSLAKFGLETLNESELTVVEAIKESLKQHFVVYEWSIDLIYCGSKSGTLTEKLLREKSLEVKIRVINLDAAEKVLITGPAIFLFDSLTKYVESMNKLSWIVEKEFQLKSFPNILYFVPKHGIHEIVEWFASNSHHIHGASFLRIVNDTTVDLITSFLFEPGQCKEPQYKTINRFSRSSLQWDNKTFFPEKYENFNGCELIVAYNQMYAIHGSEMFLDVSTRVMNILAEELNFKIKYEEIDQQNSKDHENYDLYNKLGGQSSAPFKFHDFSPVIHTDEITCTVPAGEPYTQFEKMFLMFDKYTWICIGVTLVGSLLVIQVVNRMSIKIQKFVFGRNVQTPTLNVASVFLSGSQHRVPGRNFARFLLMLFICWSVIIRTCYQSILYKNLQQDIRKPMIKTFDELNEKNFSIIIAPGAEHILGVDFVER